jgi:hypothetical protein
MEYLFLPREQGSTIVGPQVFRRVVAPNSPFIFRRDPVLEDVPGLFNSARIQNAGWNNLNGIFIYTFLFNDKPYYNKDGNSNWFIIWFNNQWQVYDFSENSVDPIYFSNQDVLYPWNVTNWTAVNSIYNPTPTVTKVL